MKYELLACDIDGTLLNTKREITPKTAEAVGAMIKHNKRFVLSTGRPYNGVLGIMDKLGLKDRTIIIYNGATVIADGKIIYSICLDKKIAETVVERGRSLGVTVILWKGNVLYTEKPCEKIEFYKKLACTEPNYVQDLLSVCDENVTKIVWYDWASTAKEHCDEMNSLISSCATAYLTRDDFIEFVNKDCSKGTALKMIADYFGVDISKTVAIGDNHNDIPMFEAAGLSVAMENAEDFVKKSCDYVTDSCDNDGVAKAIYKFFID